MSKEVEIKWYVYEGRVVSNMTAWWAKHNWNLYELFCRHSVRLTEYCPECDKEVV